MLASPESIPETAQTLGEQFGWALLRTGEVVRSLAGGRVMSGTRALEHGLVDRLGGPLEALAEVRRRAGLSGGLWAGRARER